MVQYAQATLDEVFNALSDGKRRGVLEHLGRQEASISDLADRFEMTLTGMRKHVGVLEKAGLVVSRKVGRVRSCHIGPQRLDEVTNWIEQYRHLWEARFDALDEIVEDLKQKEQSHGKQFAQ